MRRSCACSDWGFAFFASVQQTTRANKTRVKKNFKIDSSSELPGKLSLGAARRSSCAIWSCLYTPLFLKALPLGCWGPSEMLGRLLRVWKVGDEGNTEKDDRREPDPGAVSVINNDNQIPKPVKGKGGQKQGSTG
jgi:hypothetical protein